MTQKDEKSPKKHQFIIFRRPLKPEHFIAIFKELHELFPKCFDFSNVRPLKKGIIDELIERTSREQFTENALRRFIGQYVSTPEYVNNHIIGAKRIDLDGNEIEQISEGDYKGKFGALERYKKKFDIE
jgi:sRNA-binding protein